MRSTNTMHQLLHVPHRPLSIPPPRPPPPPRHDTPTVRRVPQHTPTSVPVPPGPHLRGQRPLQHPPPGDRRHPQIHRPHSCPHPPHPGPHGHNPPHRNPIPRTHPPPPSLPPKPTKLEPPLDGVLTVTRKNKWEREAIEGWDFLSVGAQRYQKVESSPFGKAIFDSHVYMAHIYKPNTSGPKVAHAHGPCQ